MKVLYLTEEAYKAMWSALCNALSYAEVAMGDFDEETPMYAWLKDEKDDAEMALDWLERAQEVE